MLKRLKMKHLLKIKKFQSFFRCFPTLNYLLEYKYKIENIQVYPILNMNLSVKGIFILRRRKIWR